MDRSAPGIGYHGPRFAAGYFAQFLVLGVYLPFWPIYLAGRGLKPDEIGAAVAATVLVRVAGAPLYARLADRLDARRALLLAASLASLAVLPAFLVLDGFWPILAGAVLWGLAFSGAIPLLDSLAQLAGREQGMAYGSVRLWGSLSFLLAAVAAGRLIEATSPALVLGLMIASGALALPLITLVPDLRAAGHPPGPDDAPGSRLLAQPGIALFLAAIALIQGSHAVCYGFASLHWLKAGHGETLVGLLWAEGVLAEILLFAAGSTILDRVRPVPLLILAGLGAVLRWLGLAAFTSLPALLLIQPLHALSFAAAHLAAMRFMAEAVPARRTAGVQGLHTAAVTLAFALCAWAAGPLYAALDGGAFLVMAAIAAAGMAAACPLLTRPTLKC